jgi:DNA-binding CsgD family transcriptional regulator
MRIAIEMVIKLREFEMDIYWFDLIKKARQKKVRHELLSSAELDVMAKKIAPKQACEFGPIKKKIGNLGRIVMLGKNYPGVYLTEREAHVGLHLLRGCTCDEAAEQMHLSRRTVEYYVTNIKTKLGSRRKSTVVAALLASDFIRNFNYLTNTISLDERAKMAEKV